MKTKEQLEAIESWFHRYQVILICLQGIEKEKEALNHPISQPTENMMFIASKSVEFAMNACESELEVE